MKPSPIRVAYRFAVRFESRTPVAWDIERLLGKFLEANANSRMDIGKPFHDRPHRNDRNGLSTIRGTFRTDTFYDDPRERQEELRRIQGKVSAALRSVRKHIADIEVRYVENGQWGIRVQFTEPAPKPS